MSQKNHSSSYGTVSSKKLDELQHSFDTTKILAAVDAIDEIRYRICEPDGMRRSFAESSFNGSHDYKWRYHNECT